MSLAAAYRSFRSIGDSPWAASALLLLLATVAIFGGLGASGLDEFDESLYASVAREIWRTGDVVHLRIGDQPYFNKPPLYMMLTALAYEGLGVSEFSARLVSALMGVAHAALGYCVMRSLFGGPRAFVAMVLMLAHYHFLGVTRSGRMESLVSLCMLAGFAALLKCRTDGRWWPAVGLAVGLGVLAKGPMGLMLLLVALPCLVWDPALRQGLTLGRAALALGAAALVAAPWYVAELMAYGGTYVDVFLGHQILDRVTANMHGRERGIGYFIYRITSYNFGTWSLLAPAALLFVGWRVWQGRSVKYLYLASYVLVPLFIFSVLVKTKLHQYIFCIYVPLAMCALLLIEALGRRWAPAPTVFAGLAVITALIYPLSDRVRNQSLPTLTPALHRVVSAGNGPLVVAGVNPQGPIFYGDTIVGAAPGVAALIDRMKTACAYGLAPADDFPQAAAQGDVKVLGRTADHVLFASPLCR